MHLNSPSTSNPKAARNQNQPCTATAGRERAENSRLEGKDFLFFHLSLCWKGNALEQNDPRVAQLCDLSAPHPPLQKQEMKLLVLSKLGQDVGFFLKKKREKINSTYESITFLTEQPGRTQSPVKNM